MKSIGIILAGGTGQRFGGVVPKQFTKLAGKLVIEHTIDIFQRSADVDEVIVVSRLDYAELIWNLVKQNNWTKVTKVINGGEDRFGSTDSAIQALSGEPDTTKVLFHDAVRPLLRAEVIRDCIDALDAFPAVDVVIPSSDTLVAVHDNGCIANIPSRSSMRRGQTPQGFRLSAIREAYAKAKKLGRRDFTCDCGVIRAMLPQADVATVAGAETNIKITNPLDIFLAEKLIQSNGGMLDAEAHHLQALRGKTLVIFGGSSGIGKSIHDMAILNGAKVHTAGRAYNNVDVANMQSVTDFLSSVAEQGPIDIVINSAGLLIKKPFDGMTQEEIHTLIATNYTGAINVAYAAKPHLARTHGVLINFTSSSYTRGRAYYAVYSSTKCAVVNLTQALAEEWHLDDIRVNCINPERTRTPMRTKNFGVEPAGSLLEPEAVALTSLATALSGYTGMIVDVRKGRSASSENGQ